MAKIQGFASKFDVELFNGKNNFSLWQSTVKDILVQQGLIKALNGKAKKPDKMSDEDWEELEMKAVSTIRLCLAPQVKFSVLNETSAVDLWKKLENMYMSKSLTNRLFLKKELYQLRMDDGVDLRDDLNDFTNLITQLASIGDKVDDEDKALLLLSSLPQSYDNLVTTLLVGKEILMEDDVIAVMLENEKFKKPSIQTEGAVFAVKSDRGRNVVRGNNYGRESSRSRSRPRADYKDKECYYCHEMGHIKFFCKKLEEDLAELKKSKEKGKERSEGDAAIVQDSCSYEGDLLMVEDDKDTVGDDWLLDSASSNHVCSKKEWFDTYDTCDEEVRLADKTRLKAVGKGTVKIKMHNGCVKTFGNVKYVPSLGRNLISLGKLDGLGYGYSTRGGAMQVSKGSLVMMKGVKSSGNLYKLIGETVMKKENV